MESFRCFFTPLNVQFLSHVWTIQSQNDFLLAFARLPDCLVIAVNHVVWMGILRCAGRCDILAQRPVMLDHRRRFIQQFNIRPHQVMVRHIGMIRFNMGNVDILCCNDVVDGHDLHRVIFAVERIKPDAVLTVGDVVVVFEDIVLIQTLVGIEVRHQNFVRNRIRSQTFNNFSELPAAQVVVFPAGVSHIESDLLAFFFNYDAF